MSRQEMRRWALAGSLALLVGFILTSVVNILARGDSQHSNAAAGASSHAGAGDAWLGARMRTESGGGAVVESVSPGSPAQASGLAPGDLIIGIDNDAVNSADDVSAALSRDRPGDTVAVQARRAAAGFTAQVTLVSRPAGRSVP